MQADAYYMRRALEQARRAAEEGEIPVGAVIVSADGEVLAETHNLCERDHLPTSHAELLAVQAACRRRGSWRLSDCTLYVTLEPCPMCMGAIIHARVGRVVFGAKDPRAGAAGSLLNLCDYPLESKPVLSEGLLAEESLEGLRSFFVQKRKQQ